MLEKCIMFIDKTLKWCLITELVIKHPSIYISSSYNWGIRSRGVIPQYCKSHNFWNFTDFTLGYIEGKRCNFWRFQASFMKSYTIIVKTLSKHMIIVILHFLVKNVVLKKNCFISQNYWSFTETRVMGTENNLWKFELDQIIFLDSTGIGSLNIKK